MARKTTLKTQVSGASVAAFIEKLSDPSGVPTAPC